MDVADLLPTSDDAKFLNVRYEERWDCLRHIIVPLYMTKKDPYGKPTTITQVSTFMKTHYSFHAAESQYKNQFKKWGVRRRTFKAEKEAIIHVLGKRSRSFISTPDITLGENKKVDKKQMTRYINDQFRHYAQEAQVRVPGVLLSWSLPYAAYLKALGADPCNNPCAFPVAVSTPSSSGFGRPGDSAAIVETTTAPPSPTMQRLRETVACKRASYFFQGRNGQLLESCDDEERVTMVNYLHDLYLYSFVRTKYWGKGPKDWTADMVSVFTSRSTKSPDRLSETTSPSAGVCSDGPNGLTRPKQLCRWPMHDYQTDKYVVLADTSLTSDISRTSDDVGGWSTLETIQVSSGWLYPGATSDFMANEEEFDENPMFWNQWPVDNAISPADLFCTSLSNSISDGTFSLTPPDTLPSPMTSIVQSSLQDPELLVVDGCKLAIMAGNLTLVSSLSQKAARAPGSHTRAPFKKIFEIYPFHLAATYLDGAAACCSIFLALGVSLGEDTWVYHRTDELGHTILDCLMINILRSHTTVTPEAVSTRFQPPHRFPGEEKSTCGRWDADTPAVRQLFDSGCARIPTSWKHPFCHTSAQAICHSLFPLFGYTATPAINYDSGLFVCRCIGCGETHRLGPLHTLVVVSLFLASRGMAGETLFGALAILVCLIGLGADPGLVKEISIADIFGATDSATDSATCRHRSMNALELMQAVPKALVDSWTAECRIGWQCMIQVLILAKAEKAGLGQSPADTGRSDRSKDLPHLGLKLGVVWMTIQAELLTYRRAEVDAPWISDNFSMARLRNWLTGEVDDHETSLLRSLMDEHYRCYLFRGGGFSCAHVRNINTSWNYRHEGPFGIQGGGRSPLDAPWLGDIWEDFSASLN